MSPSCPRDPEQCPFRCWGFACSAPGRARAVFVQDCGHLSRTGVPRVNLAVATPPDPGGVGPTTCCSRPSLARVPQSGPPNRVRTMQPPPKTDITLTPHSPWVWHVSRADKRLGTVSGDSVAGFTASDINSRSIGHGYVSAEAAKEAWTGPPTGGQSGVTYPPGATTVF